MVWGAMLRSSRVRCGSFFGRSLDTMRCTAAIATFLCAASVGLSPDGVAQAKPSVRTRVHVDYVGQVSDDAMESIGPDDVLWSEQLPSALQRPTSDRLPPVEGPVHLAVDPRAVTHVPPWDADAYRTRFFPTWRWARPVESLTLSAQQQDVRVRWSPTAGACYAVLAVDPTLEAYAERAKVPGFRWYEVGNDIDVQVRRAKDGSLISEDLSREAFPRVQWCSDGDDVTIEFRLPIPSESDPTVDVVWGIAVDPTTLPPLRFEGSSPLSRRMVWAHSIVVPRGRAVSAPVIVHAPGPTLVQLEFPRPARGCEAIVAVGEPTVEALAVAIDDAPQLPGDYGGKDIAAVHVCADATAPALVQVVVAVRAGEGRVAVQRFTP